MRRRLCSRTYAGAVLMILFSSGWALPARAVVEHQVSHFLDDVSGNRLASDGENLRVPTVGDITRPISASISTPQAQASGSVGIFGNLGIEGQQIGPGKLLSQVFISNDEFVNTSSLPQRAEMNFIVDGGSLILNAAPGAILDFNLTINAFGDASECSFPCFQSIIVLEDTSVGGGNPTVSMRGDSLGAVDLGNGEVVIPFSFQSIDLGLIPGGGRLDIEYILTIETNVPSFAEALRYEFSDPLDVEGDSGERPVVVFATPEAVPPLALLLLAPLVRAARARLG